MQNWGQLLRLCFSAPKAGYANKKGVFAMFPNNPLFVDKLIQSRQEDIERGIPDPSTYDFQQTDKLPVKLRTKARILVSVGVLLVLAWWVHVLM